MRYWTYPAKWWQWCLFVKGFVLFWLLFPVWLVCAVFWWKGDSEFVLDHLYAIFLNSWNIKG